jgi:hypothetical protein
MKLRMSNKLRNIRGCIRQTALIYILKNAFDFQLDYLFHVSGIWVRVDSRFFERSTRNQEYGYKMTLDFVG